MRSTWITKIRPYWTWIFAACPVKYQYISIILSLPAALQINTNLKEVHYFYIFLKKLVASFKSDMWAVEFWTLRNLKRFKNTLEFYYEISLNIIFHYLSLNLHVLKFYRSFMNMYNCNHTFLSFRTKVQ